MFHKSLYKAYLVAFTILVVCLLPGGSLPKVGGSIFAFDKWIHFIMYIPLTWTLVYGFKVQKRFFKLASNALLLTFIIASCYGAFIEWLQFVLTPDRCAEWLDFFADVAGVSLGILTHKFGIHIIVKWNALFRKFLSSHFNAF